MARGRGRESCGCRWHRQALDVLEIALLSRHDDHHHHHRQVPGQIGCPAAAQECSPPWPTHQDLVRPARCLWKIISFTFQNEAMPLLVPFKMRPACVTALIGAGRHPLLITKQIDVFDVSVVLQNQQCSAQELLRMTNF